MHEDIKQKKRKAPIVCAAAVIALLGLYLAVILFSLIGEAFGGVLAVLFLLIYGGVIIAVICGVIAALRQRLQEIEGGEEEDAKKY